MSEVTRGVKTTEFPDALGIEEIRAFLPHRQPFLLVDRVYSIRHQGYTDGKTPEQFVGSEVRALKNVSFNEPFFFGHFPDYSIVPGVLILEAMAQAASFSIYPIHVSKRKTKNDIQVILLGANEVRFRRPVVPGDALKIRTVCTKCRGKIWVFDCEATVEGEKVANAEVMASIFPNLFS